MDSGPGSEVGAADDFGAGTSTPAGFHADARAAARAFVRDRLPPAAIITHEWTGVIGWSEDNLPWVGSVPGRPAHLVCAGFSGHGMAQTFLCGAAVAHIARTGAAPWRFVSSFIPDLLRRRDAAPWGSADPQAGASASDDDDA